MYLIKKMNISICLLLSILLIQEIAGPPVTEKKNNEKDSDHAEGQKEEEPNALNVEYDRYLREVVSALESDPSFREKLEKAEEVDIRSGKIAKELEYVNHQVRSKLDELKRQELERLRHLATREFELQNQMDTEHLKISPQHLDHLNPNSFEIEDLRKLIAKTTNDLMEADKKRKEEFKEYEMQKEFEKQEQLKALDDETRQKLQHDYDEMKKKHQEHKPLHHPGSKPQLEEVWEKEDHMDAQDFDPKAFFALHDLDGNGVWDENEVKTLFRKELDKLYDSGAPEDDMRERAEEMERMREHVFAEADVNKDGLISYKEFIAQTRKPEFEKDPGWESLDQQQIYTHEEYQQFEKQRQAEVDNMIARGLLPPQAVLHLPPGYEHVLPHDNPQNFQGQPGYMGPGGQMPPMQAPMHPAAHHNPQAQPHMQQQQIHHQMQQGQVPPQQQGQFHHPQVQAQQAQFQQQQHAQFQQQQAHQQAQIQQQQHAQFQQQQAQQQAHQQGQIQQQQQAHQQGQIHQQQQAHQQAQIPQQAQFQQQQAQQQQQQQFQQPQPHQQPSQSQPQLNQIPIQDNNKISNQIHDQVDTAKNEIPQAVHTNNEQNHINQQEQVIVQQHHQPSANKQN